MDDTSSPLSLEYNQPPNPGLIHPIFSPSHLIRKTTPLLYLVTDGRRLDPPAGLVGVRGRLGTPWEGKEEERMEEEEKKERREEKREGRRKREKEMILT